MNSLILFIIRIYQGILSPSKGVLSVGYHTCKFIPSCSEYAYEAFQKKHFFKALFLSIKRIFRCNPFSNGGYDPV